MFYKKFLTLLVLVLLSVAQVCAHAANTDSRGYMRDGKIEKWDRDLKGSNAAGINKQGYYMNPDTRYELESNMSEEQYQEHQRGEAEARRWDREHQESIQYYADQRRKKAEEEELKQIREREKAQEIERRFERQRKQEKEEKLRIINIVFACIFAIVIGWYIYFNRDFIEALVMNSAHEKQRALKPKKKRCPEPRPTEAEPGSSKKYVVVELFEDKQRYVYEYTLWGTPKEYDTIIVRRNGEELYGRFIKLIEPPFPDTIAWADGYSNYLEKNFTQYLNAEDSKKHLYCNE